MVDFKKALDDLKAKQRGEAQQLLDQRLADMPQTLSASLVKVVDWSDLNLLITVTEVWLKRGKVELSQSEVANIEVDSWTQRTKW